MAVEFLQIWYKNTPYRGGLNVISNKNPTKTNGKLFLKIPNMYSFAYLFDS